MTPYQQALALYESIGESEQQLLIDIAWHVHHGYVYASPDGFAMARPVCSKWDAQRIVDHTDTQFVLTDTSSDLDCWHVHIAIGGMRTLLEQLPYSLPYISYERRGKLRIHKIDKYEVTKATSTNTNSTTC